MCSLNSVISSCSELQGSQLSLADLLKVTQLLSRRAGILVQVCLSPASNSCIHTLQWLPFWRQFVRGPQWRGWRPLSWRSPWRGSFNAYAPGLLNPSQTLPMQGLCSLVVCLGTWAQIFAFCCFDRIGKWGPSPSKSSLFMFSHLSGYLWGKWAGQGEHMLPASVCWE